MLIKGSFTVNFILFQQGTNGRVLGERSEAMLWGAERRKTNVGESSRRLGNRACHWILDWSASGRGGRGVERRRGHRPDTGEFSTGGFTFHWGPLGSFTLLGIRNIICPASPPLLWPVPWFGSLGCVREAVQLVVETTWTAGSQEAHQGPG